MQHDSSEGPVTLLRALQTQTQTQRRGETKRNETIRVETSLLGLRFPRAVQIR
jgi:hypothetical protein